MFPGEDHPRDVDRDRADGRRDVLRLLVVDRIHPNDHFPGVGKMIAP